MEPDELPPPPRRSKPKYIPRAPARKKHPPAPKSEVSGEDEKRKDSREDAESQRLLRRFSDNHAKEVLRGEKKSTVQVAFGPGATSSDAIQTLGVPEVCNSGKHSSAWKKGCRDTVELKPSLDPTAKAERPGFDSVDATDGVAQPQENKDGYMEPWDYEHSYYPTTHPWRKPYAGDPEILNEAEFGKAVEYDENTLNSASEIGLLDANERTKMILFKLPANLPLVKRSASVKGKEKGESSPSSKNLPASEKGCSFEELPGGYMGKLLVYRSGAVKLKLGEILYEVSPGTACTFAQDVAAINAVDKQCCVLGELDERRAVVTPDVPSLLDSSNE